MKVIDCDKAMELIRLVQAGNPHPEPIVQEMQELINKHSFDAEPVVHGQWKRAAEEGYLSLEFYCSVCGMGVRYEEEIECEYDFCPYCCATMDLEA